MVANQVVYIDQRVISNDAFPFLIAEIGVNHNGDMQIAKKLIDAVFACNWHCVKFQKRTPDIAVPEHQKNVMRETPWGNLTYLEYRYKIEFGKEQYDYIDMYCREKPLMWSSSVWDIPSLEFMLSYNIPFVKIPSAMITNHDLIVAACHSRKPLILSTGMSTLEEIDELVNWLEHHSNGDYILMHTNSTYPTPTNEINLSVINLLKERYSCLVGYSGHEYDLEPTVAAVTLGAKVVERHITLDHNMWGSDHFASLEVHAMDKLQKRIQNIFTAIGDGVKRLTEKEQQARLRLRGS
jgi:N-acetylneuraminate synthase